MALPVTRKRFWFAAGLGVAVLWYVMKHADPRRLLADLQGADPFWLLMALGASLLSYVFIAAVLHKLLEGMGHGLPFRPVFEISLLCCTLNYLMSMAGLSGVAAKVYLLAKRNIPPGSTLSISIIHGFLTNTVAVLFIYLGFFFLYSQYKLSRRQLEVGVVVLVIAFGLTWLTVQVSLDATFRRRLWRLIIACATRAARAMKRPGLVNLGKAEAFFEHFDESMTFMVKKGRILAVPAAYALLDWLFMFLCLKWSFLAANYPVDNKSLLVGFSVAILVGLFSVTPASLGVMEGSMAGSFYLMGLDFDRALLATLIYRCAYYIIPLLLSLLFYRRFFPAAAEAQGVPPSRTPPNAGGGHAP